MSGGKSAGMYDVMCDGMEGRSNGLPMETSSHGLLDAASHVRVGTGWDLHVMEEGRPLVIGGVRIESPKGCIAHSDGDVLIHALIDALLGACGMDDIGTLFPDDDPAFKDADSSVLLGKVVSMVASKGFHIVNADSTVVLQSPRLGAYKGSMKERLALILGVDPSMVCVKAKTAEGVLGELGRGDAVMAQAVVLVVR